MATTRLLSAMVATWNNVATTFTGLKLNVTDTASAAGSLLMDLQVDGASKFKVDKTGQITSPNGIVTGNVFGTGTVGSNSNTGTLFLGSNADVTLARDAANTLALRNGTAAQTFNWYKTYTDASNYERGSFYADVNGLHLETQQTGTGAPQNLYMGPNGNAALYLATNNASRWLVSGSGQFLAVTDNTYDIGASGANRPRNVYIGTATYTPVLRFNALGSVEASGDGNVLMRNNAGTDFGMLKFGGTSSTFPAMKRSGTEIQFRLADDSAYSDIRVNKVFAHYGIVFNQDGYISPSADGKFVFADKAGASFGMIQLGGTTSSFPALKRSGTGIQVRLADDSGYSSLSASSVTASNGGFYSGYGTYLADISDGVARLSNNGVTGFTRLILGTNDTSGIAIKKNGTSFSFVLGDDSAFASVDMKDITTSNTTFLHATSASLANGAAAQVATMTNGPTAGNPTKWIAINDNGTTRYIPAW